MSEGVRYHTGKFPPKNLDLAKLFPLNGPAMGEIRHYAALSKALPNPDLLLSPLRLKEATLSCAIEGTTVTLDEALSYEGGSKNLENDPEKKREVQEVRNYREALRVSIDLMSHDHERPFAHLWDGPQEGA